MKPGTYSVTVSGFLTKEDAEDYAQSARESTDDGQLEADVTTPEVKSFQVQQIEREVERDTTATIT